MLFKICFFTVFLVYLIVLDNLVKCNSYNALKTKNLSRLPRSNSKTNNNNEEFEKFFLKASKSVPRIGRRGSMNDFYAEGGFNGASKYQFLNPYPKRSTNKNLGAPFWSDIAQIYEYNPDLPNILEYMSNFEQEQGDDPSVFDLNKMRYKKKSGPNYGSQNKEVMEYRIQAEV